MPEDPSMAQNSGSRAHKPATRTNAKASIPIGRRVSEYDGAGVLSRYLVDHIEELAVEFATAKPFRHVLINPFFDEDLCEKLIQQFPKPDPCKMVNEFGGKSGKYACSNVRGIGATYRRLDDFVSGPKFQKIMGAITGIPHLLYDPEYHGAGTHENFSGQGMDTHVDFNFHRTTGYHRRINAIIYLNDEWQESWGGCLELHKDPWNFLEDTAKKFLPLKNHCVLFETNEYSWHGFEPVVAPAGKELTRRSFTIYMYTKERPAAEVAEKHNTVYVQAGTPKHFKVGHVLSQRDLDDVNSNFKKRNTYLQAIYAREKKFFATINSLHDYVNAFRLPAVGFARAVGPPEGAYPNFGVTAALRSNWVCSDPVVGITISGRLPAYIPENQLHVDFGNQSAPVSFNISGEFKVDVPCNFQAGQTIKLRVTADVAKSPKEAGEGPDIKPYSWFLREISFKS
jgi:Rps23 Pro-64 3,4-dihydroxylase Tpa1-like proline 4-hydroxylase